MRAGAECLGRQRGQQGVWGDQGLALVLPVGEQQLQPFRQVDDGGGHAARGRLLVRIALSRGHEPALLVSVQHGAIAARLEVAVAVAGRCHAQRLEQLFVGQLLPGASGGPGHRLRAYGGAEVGVVVGRAERVQRQQAQAGDHVGAAESQVFEIVARRARQAGAVREEIADRGAFGHVGVAQFEVRQIARNRIVPGNLALGNFDGRHRRRQRLGDRCDLEHGLRIHRRLLARLARAVALCQHGLAVDDHGHGHARHLAAPHDVRHDLRQFLYGAFLAAGGNGHRVGGRIRRAGDGHGLRPDCRGAAQRKNGCRGDERVFAVHDDLRILLGKRCGKRPG